MVFLNNDNSTFSFIYPRSLFIAQGANGAEH